MNEEILVGRTASTGIVSGPAKIIKDEKDLDKLKQGDILVAKITEVTFVPYLGKVKGIITEDGGITSHAAIISRELGIPCVIGVENATEKIKNNEKLFLNATKGIVSKTSTITNFKQHSSFDVDLDCEGLKLIEHPTQGIITYDERKNEIVVNIPIEYDKKQVISFFKKKFNKTIKEGNPDKHYLYAHILEMKQYNKQLSKDYQQMIQDLQVLNSKMISEIETRYEKKRDKILSQIEKQLHTSLTIEQNIRLYDMFRVALAYHDMANITLTEGIGLRTILQTFNHVSKKLTMSFVQFLEIVDNPKREQDLIKLEKNDEIKEIVRSYKNISKIRNKYAKDNSVTEHIMNIEKTLKNQLQKQTGIERKDFPTAGLWIKSIKDKVGYKNITH